jgi:hypothetical protein
MELALAQYNPVLLAARLTTLGAPTVPALKTVAVKSSVFRAPARYVTVMLFEPEAGAFANNRPVFPAV